MPIEFYVPKIKASKKTEWLFAAICPATKNVLEIEPDKSNGTHPFGDAEFIVSCHHCQAVHAFPGSDIFALEPKEK